MKLLLLFEILTAVLLAGLSQGVDAVTERTFTIKTTWNNSFVPENEYIEIRFSAPENNIGVRGMSIDVKAPFYNDSAPPGNPGRFDGLWDYEVVEVFFLGSDDKYVELEFGPHGHYLVYQLDGVRNPVNKTQELLEYSATINNEENTWVGRAFIAEDQLPEGVDSFNAYAIHGEGEERVYMALYPNEDENATGPDFHLLEAFQPIDLNGLVGNGALGSITVSHWIQFSLLFLLACMIFP